MAASDEMVRVYARLDKATADEVKQLADGMGLSVSKMLGVLLTVAIKSTAGTFEAFAGDLAKMMGKDDPTT